MTFNTISIALPKIVDERLGEGVPLLAVGSLATAVFMCGAVAQIVVGRLVEYIKPYQLFAVIVTLQFLGILWAANASGMTLLLALALTMAAIYGQVTVGDLVIARYTADAWRGRVYAVRYFLTFVSSGAAVSIIAFLYSRGGFDLLLMTVAGIAAVFLIGVSASCCWCRASSARAASRCRRNNFQKIGGIRSSTFTRTRMRFLTRRRCGSDGILRIAAVAEQGRRACPI